MPINWIGGYVIVGKSLLVKLFICELLGCEVLGVECFLWKGLAYNNHSMALDFWNPRTVLQHFMCVGTGAFQLVQEVSVWI